jgi:copper chaperone CopZ
MEVLSLELPAMYGDHHVIEVRRLLFEMTGIDEVYASSGFRAVEVTFDPDKVNAEDIKEKLDQAGYIGELPIPVEVHGESAATGNGRKGFFRHTAAYETTNKVVSFGQTVNYEGRALWPCPGMAPLTGMMDEE